jgi:hypothetical protein
LTGERLGGEKIINKKNKKKRVYGLQKKKKYSIVFNVIPPHRPAP